MRNFIEKYNELPIAIDKDNDTEFDESSVEIDSFCATHDIDEYDLFGEIMVEDEEDDSNIKWE